MSTDSTCLICDRALSGEAYACQVCAGQVTTWLTRALKEAHHA